LTDAWRDAVVRTVVRIKRRPHWIPSVIDRWSRRASRGGWERGLRRSRVVGIPFFPIPEDALPRWVREHGAGLQCTGAAYLLVPRREEECLVLLDRASEGHGPVMGISPVRSR